jgi:hypothetical protein
MSDLKNLFPPIRIAQTTMVIIPIGAIPIRTSSAKPIEVARNCFVNSSPKRVRSGAKSLKALFSKFEGSTFGITVAVAVAVALEVVDMMKLSLTDGLRARVGNERESDEIRILLVAIGRYRYEPGPFKTLLPD